MRIIYFTTSIRENDYVEFSKKWKIALNSSNQNFHNKFIRALAKSEKIDVISLRPFSFSKCELKKLRQEKIVEGNITWNYLKVCRIKAFRFTSFKQQINRIFHNDKCEDAIILSETINPNVIHLANILSKKKKRKIVGICTDSPSNITGTKRAYSLFLLKQSKELDAYLTLTESLNDLFNEKNKPHLVIEGIVEEVISISENKYGDYFYFGGSLLPRYGVYQLIEAFKELNKKDIKLIISGHHADQRKIREAIGKASNIQYLKMLPVKEVLSLESNALLNINPRPYTEDLDRFSIPSKTLEYFSTGTLTLSTRNNKLQSLFNECAIWVKSSNKNDLLEGMEKVLRMSAQERNKLGLEAQKKVKELYSLTIVNHKVSGFLKKLFSN